MCSGAHPRSSRSREDLLICTLIPKRGNIFHFLSTHIPCRNPAAVAVEEGKAKRITLIQSHNKCTAFILFTYSFFILFIHHVSHALNAECFGALFKTNPTKTKINREPILQPLKRPPASGPKLITTHNDKQTLDPHRRLKYQLLPSELRIE